MGYKRNAETQRRLKNKYVDRYRCPIYYDEEKGRYIRCHFGKASAKGYRAYVKKQSARRIRRSAEIYQEKGKHHRHYDFWWELI